VKITFGLSPDVHDRAATQARSSSSVAVVNSFSPNSRRISH
jgi:hypothetical protein